MLQVLVNANKFIPASATAASIAAVAKVDSRT
jgi:hypothetical protein